jgi:hypothetical protein
MESMSPERSTRSGPLAESNRTLVHRGTSSVKITWAEARVAWPHRSTSSTGWNQRMR